MIYLFFPTHMIYHAAFHWYLHSVNNSLAQCGNAKGVASKIDEVLRCALQALTVFLKGCSSDARLALYRAFLAWPGFPPKKRRTGHASPAPFDFACHF